MMTTGQEVLKFYNIDQKTAMDFIMANINNPTVIFNTASDYGITNQHLSHITGYSTDTIRNYFESFNLDSEWLDEVKILFNSELGNLSYLVNFNNRTGSLSTSSLREQVKASLDDSADYDFFFESVYDYQEADGLYTPDETGISHLGNIQATHENLESIFYGTLINILNALDIEELKEISEFPEPPLGNLDDFIVLVSEALSDTPATPYPDSFLQTNTVSDAVKLIEDYWSPDSTTIGILDNSSFLGLVIA
jgi:hypothetical protein